MPQKRASSDGNATAMPPPPKPVHPANTLQETAAAVLATQVEQASQAIKPDKMTRKCLKTSHELVDTAIEIDRLGQKFQIVVGEAHLIFTSVLDREASRMIEQLDDSQQAV